MKTFLTQICLTKKGVYSSYTLTRKIGRTTTGITLIALASVLVTAPAAAGICLVGGDPWGYGQVGKDRHGRGYPVWLHDTKITLWTGKTTGRAFAQGYLQPGDILSIDRTRNATNNWWLWQWQVDEMGGGWDYCDTHAPFSGTKSTVAVDGYKHAVRPCLRRNGYLMCAVYWYADQDR